MENKNKVKPAAEPYKNGGNIAGMNETAFIAPSLLGDIEVFKKMAEAAPYTIWISDPDGFTLFMNAAGIRMFLPDRDMPTFPMKESLSTYNFLTDPKVANFVPLEELKRVQKGETVIFHTA